MFLEEEEEGERAAECDLRELIGTYRFNRQSIFIGIVLNALFVPLNDFTFSNVTCSKKITK